MLFRAIIAFIAFPGVVAYAIPVATGLYTGRPPLHVPLAVTLIVAGSAGLLWCVREFYVAGRGTLAPWARPRHLVTTGPYQFSRNPMYVSCTVILLGWCVLWDSPGLRIYAVVSVLVMAARVVFLEEVWVTRNFGAEWDHYRARTPRWLIPVRSGRAAGAFSSAASPRARPPRPDGPSTA
jgi:protein-S-isoprenylcysteine O-methyltransferase Ste14